MLKVNKTRQMVAEFFVTENGEERLVKTTTVNTDKNAVSTVFETLHEPDLYSKHRKDMRKDEAALRQMRYAIEDAILDEQEAEEVSETD
ncbi:hypothetical protein [Streptococcus himalayensis]|uniref:Uncharacterized protein n=1 Tax=Streptococcus himalayensis TaxID=1888195 RepID=A0A917EDL0_9STRE|nr:hypothetical protein [Streptococcus himalayensis]QBX25360.1 hypothetical protein Javan254_0005 [Streptococcus phage Javan254]GGE26237.1 hypothetical protein GCM10011510_04240 [Streptococcus himalayensis]